MDKSGSITKKKATKPKSKLRLIKPFIQKVNYLELCPVHPKNRKNGGKWYVRLTSIILSSIFKIRFGDAASEVISQS